MYIKIYVVKKENYRVNYGGGVGIGYCVESRQYIEEGKVSGFILLLIKSFKRVTIVDKN